MALSGNLKEFELPDIFQLIGQQNKTGRLVLQDGDRRASVVFSQGRIVAAATENSDTISMLAKYLIRAKRYPQVKVNEFINFCKGSAHIFADVLLRIQYISQDELLAVAQMAIEDHACELFQWRKGTYRFEPMASVTDSIVADIAFTADAITMEAMRRVDDWPRMLKELAAGAVVIPAQATARALAAPSHVTPAAEPLRHVLQLLNGARTVDDVAAASFLSRYRIHEMLYQALQAKRVLISQLPSPERKKASAPPLEDTQETLHASLAALVTALCVIASFFLGSIALPRWLMSERFAQSRYASAAEQIACREQKTRIAALQYEIYGGKRAASPQDLIELKLLAPRDLVRPAADPKK